MSPASPAHKVDPGAAKPASKAPSARTPAALVPDWHGRYNARRRLRRSDPKLLRSLVIMAVAAMIGAALSLSFLVLQNLKTSDQLHAQVASLEIAAKTTDLFNEAEDVIKNVAPSFQALSEESDQADAATLRQLRRETFAAMEGSPVAGLIMVDALGEVLVEVGDSQRAALANRAKQPLEPNAQVLDDQIAFLKSDGGPGVRAHLRLADTDRTLIALIDPQMLADAMTPRSELIRSAVLYDEAGRVLVAVGSVDNPAYMASSPTNDLRLHAGDNTPAAIIGKTGKTGYSQAFSASVGTPGLYVTAMAPAITLTRFFETLGPLLLAGLGLTVLCVGALVYVVQTEWKKLDRRASLDEDIVARSEIAADIMGAGVIDWRVSDGIVSYSEGWQRLFSEDQSTGDEEIFDWIDRLHPEDQDSARENYQNLAEGRVFEIDQVIKVRRRNGRFVTVRERGRARLGPSGSASRVVLVQRNVRGRKDRS